MAISQVSQVTIHTSNFASKDQNFESGNKFIMKTNSALKPIWLAQLVKAPTLSQRA